MAESFLLIIAEKVLSEIGPLLTEEIGLAWGLKKELRKLQNTLSSIKAVILDAEEQQLTSHEVCTWLGQLKDVLSDAEYLFDEFAYEAFKNQTMDSRTHRGIREKVRHFFSSISNPITFRRKMSRKVKEIREAFDEVAANKAKFSLGTHHHLQAPSNALSSRELTHSYVKASQIIGRDGDRDTILETLLDSKSPDHDVSVISIIAMGGMGKTALAKMVFNDEKIVEHFEKRIWVCLGDLNEFNVNQVMAKMVNTISGNSSLDSNPEKLQGFIRDHLSDKRFLLVLDDVWDAHRPKWMELKDLLICGGNGSKVVTTTRNSSVASNMDSSLALSLKGLPHQECVTLFKKCAFGDAEDDELLNLMTIGDEIVRKCKGVPLAIKTLGCLLFSKPSIGDWVFVRDNDIWKLEQKKDDILPALRISYNQLPFILKQCFVCCSIFPKDHIFDNLELIRHWSAYGLLRSSVRSKRAEDIGQQHIDELCARGLFQDLEDFSSVQTFKMHDLIHDLALSVSHSETKNMNYARRKGNDIHKHVRHVSFSGNEGLVGGDVSKTFLTNINVSGHSCVMPAFWSMCFEETGGGARTGELVQTCISKLSHLRLMDLSYVASLEQFPSSIVALKSLRCLDLQMCRRIKRLPDSVCQLYNLQTLLLFGCQQLEELPEDIGDLVNLVTLSVTTKQFRLSPGRGNGIESLRSLQYLAVEGCENLTYLFESNTYGDEDEELQLLYSLRTLAITNCKSLKYLFSSASSSTSTRKARKLTSLETLYISGCPHFDMASVYSDKTSMLSKLKSLIMLNLPQMESLPQWIIFPGCRSTLESLTICSCPNLGALPGFLHDVASLRRLTIRSCPKLSCLPGGMQPFSSVKELVIKCCPELSRRCKREVGEDWHKIEHIPKIELREDGDD